MSGKHEDSWDAWKKEIMSADDSELEPSSEPLTPDQARQWEAMKAEHFAIYSQLAAYAESKEYVHYATKHGMAEWMAIKVDEIPYLEEPGHLDYWLLHPYLCRVIGAGVGDLGGQTRTYVTARRVCVCILVGTKDTSHGNLQRAGSWESASNCEIITCDSIESAIDMIEMWAESIKQFEGSPWFFDQTKTPCTFHNEGNGYSYYAPPYEAARAYVDYYEAHPRQGFPASYDWILPPQVIDETTNATGLGIARSNDTQLPRTYPANVHHLSFAADIGIQNAIRATGDITRFIPNPSYGTAVARDNPSSPVWWEIDATAKADRWHEAATSDDDRNTFINDVVAAQTNLLSRDSGITNLYILQRLLQTDGELEIGIGEIQNLRGKTKRTPKEKEALTYEIKQALELWGSAKLRGTRKWKTVTGKWETVVFEDSFWHCTSVYPHGQLTLPGFYGPPKGFVIVDSTVTKIYRKHPTILHAIGKLDPFIELLQETGKVAADWALSMGWASVHYGRTNAQTRGDTINLKRKTLLTAYKPHTEAQSFIDANRPARMTDYWDEAVKKLKRHKIWANIDEPPKPNDPQGWGQKWLEQTVTITLGGDYQLHAQAVHRAKTKAIDGNKKRAKPKTKA